MIALTLAAAEIHGPHRSFITYVPADTEERSHFITGSYLEKQAIIKKPDYNSTLCAVGTK